MNIGGNVNTLINLWANANGIWQKISSVLPFVIGVGTLLCGLGGFCLEFGHAANAAAVLAIIQGLKSDPNVGLIIAGLGALGIHTNHAANVVTMQANTAAISQNTASVAEQASKTPPTV
jgi:hypothetical protein